MSYAALSWAWGVKVSATCKLVLVCLADRADDDGACFPSLRDIQARTGLSERAVRNALADMERAGVMRRDMRVNQSTRYWLHVGQVAEGGARGAPGAGNAPPAPDAPGAHNAPEGGTTCPRVGHDVPVGGAPRAPITTNEPSQEPPEEPSPPRDPAGFADWWAEYPRKDAKGAARTAYAKARKRGASVADLLTGLRRYPFNPEPQFIPHPATWLNQGRWESAHEAEPIRPASTSNLVALYERFGNIR